MQLVRRFAAEKYGQALESWAWLPDLAGKTPRLATTFGDVFLEAVDGYWFLDTIEGTLTHRWPNAAALQADVNMSEVQQQLLVVDLASAAAAAGLAPTSDQVLAFKVLPVLGGAIDVANVEVADFVVTMSLTGQIHEQVKDLPPGTGISGISIK